MESLPLALDDVLALARAGDWAAAELKRLEAYSWYDPDIEGRLKPRDANAALRLEARFWEGSASRPGLGSLIAAQDALALAGEVAGIKADLVAAQASIDATLSAPALVLQSAGILFREGLEAVLILAALLAALRAEGVAPPASASPAIAMGVALALAGSLALWAGARWLFSLGTLAREALEGSTALLAAVVLVWLVLGLSAGGGHVAALRARLAGEANPLTVGMLAFLVVFREGFETVLFYEALLADAAPLPVLAGLGPGCGGGAGGGLGGAGLGAQAAAAAVFPRHHGSAGGAGGDADRGRPARIADGGTGPGNAGGLVSRSRRTATVVRSLSDRRASGGAGAGAGADPVVATASARRAEALSLSRRRVFIGLRGSIHVTLAPPLRPCRGLPLHDPKP